MKLSQRIRAMREDHDLTQTDIAKLLNTSQTVYSRYERDERTLPTLRSTTTSPQTTFWGLQTSRKR